MKIVSFIKSIGKGFLLGIISFVIVLFGYGIYSFSHLLYFVPVINDIQEEFHENTAIVITLHNNSELRPTLGFLTGFILVKKDENGHFVIEFHDSYDIEAPKKPILAPDIIEENFSHDSRYQGWVFRDTNFDMRYTQNAKNAIAFLSYDKRYKNLNIAAVISIDMYSIESIIDAIEGVEWNGKMIYGNNFFSVLESDAKHFDRSNENAWKQRKSGIKSLALVLLKKCITRVFAWKDIGITLERLLKQQHILLYSPYPNIQEIFTKHALSGEISFDEKNIIWGINFANIGGKKGDRYIEKRVKSIFSFDENGKIHETMKIDFEHDGTRNLHSDRYFGYVRIVKPENVKLIGFKDSRQYIHHPAEHPSLFPHTSEFDFFFYVDESSSVTLELTFEYSENVQFGERKKIEIFTQPGVQNMPIEFVFQAFGDSQVSLTNCPKSVQRENISRCLFTAPDTPSFIEVALQEDTQKPLFEDVIYKNNGKIIRLQFSEKIRNISVSDVILMDKKTHEIQKIQSVTNDNMAIELTLDKPLSSDKRTFYTVLIKNFSDVFGNSSDEYNVVIAYPKYK